MIDFLLGMGAGSALSWLILRWLDRLFWAKAVAEAERIMSPELVQARREFVERIDAAPDAALLRSLGISSD